MFKLSESRGSAAKRTLWRDRSHRPTRTKKIEVKRTILTIVVAIAATAALASAPVADAASYSGFDAAHKMSIPYIECIPGGTLGMSHIRVYWPTLLTSPGAGNQNIYYNAAPEMWNGTNWASYGTQGNYWYYNVANSTGSMPYIWWNITAQRWATFTGAASGPTVTYVPKGFFRWKLSLTWGYDNHTATYTTDYCQVT